MRAFIGAAVLVLAGAPRLIHATPIEVRVEVTEVDQNQASRLGVVWNTEAEWAEAQPAGAFKIGRIDRLTPLRAKLQFLIEEGAAQILANPNLITDSGTLATFQAGGEIPYITAASLGTTHVEFKSYGVSLRIEPKLLADGQIEMKVQASISALDPTNGVSLSGNTVPALAEREVTSHVTLQAGTTLALAGLVQSQKEEQMGGVPILRKIPLLGGLFRWKNTRTRRTSVVMFITPRVKDM